MWMKSLHRWQSWHYSSVLVIVIYLSWVLLRCYFIFTFSRRILPIFLCLYLKLLQFQFTPVFLIFWSLWPHSWGLDILLGSLYGLRREWSWCFVLGCLSVMLFDFSLMKTEESYLLYLLNLRCFGCSVWHLSLMKICVPGKREKYCRKLLTILN